MLNLLYIIILSIFLSKLSSYYERKKRRKIFIEDRNFNLLNLYNSKFKNKNISYNKFINSLNLISGTLYLKPSQIKYTMKLSSYHTESIFSIHSDIDDFSYIFILIDKDKLSIYQDENEIIDLTIEELIILMCKKYK